jgi:hypothetical protein
MITNHTPLINDTPSGLTENKALTDYRYRYMIVVVLFLCQ